MLLVRAPPCWSMERLMYIVRAVWVHMIIYTTYKHLCHVEWIGFVYTSLYGELWSVIRAMDYVVATAADGMYR